MNSQGCFLGYRSAILNGVARDHFLTWLQCQRVNRDLAETGVMGLVVEQVAAQVRF